MTAGVLAGYRVLITRPALQADQLIGAIESAGGSVIRFPVIRIAGYSPNRIATQFSRSPSPDVAIFISRNAAHYGLAAVRGSGATYAAIGPATRAAIEAQGVEVDIVPEGGYDSEHLLEHPALRDVKGKNITIVRGSSGRELLGETLEKRGANVTYLPVYWRKANKIPAEEIGRLDELWRAGGIDCVTVLSVESLENLIKLLPPTSLEELRKTPLVAPGDRVIQTALDMLPGIRAVKAAGPRAVDMLNALIDARHAERNA